MSSKAKSIYIAGTFNTKGQELHYLAELISTAKQPIITVDLSTGDLSNFEESTTQTTIGRAEIASFHPDGAGAVTSCIDRGEALSAMATAFEYYVASRTDIGGIIGAGGSGGTALIAPAMRSLAIGVPKVLVSTMASGNVSPYIGASDITLIYSVTDVEGLNHISRQVLGNAAHALVGMVERNDSIDTTVHQKAIGLTMFGVTTPCVKSIISALEDRYDCLVFHATGTGGMSFEKLIDSGMIKSAIDITTTEIADRLVGGHLQAHEDRLGVFARTGVPYVGSVGALDMVNFGAPDTVPEKFKDRLFHKHNDQITLMRTTTEENHEIALWIAARVNKMTGPVRFLLPEQGVSALDKQGMSFFNPDTTAVLFDALEQNIQQNKMRQVIRVPAHINDPVFTEAVVSAFNEITN